jgi:hypothetical protein
MTAHLTQALVFLELNALEASVNTLVENTSDEFLEYLLHLSGDIAYFKAHLCHSVSLLQCIKAKLSPGSPNQKDTRAATFIVSHLAILIDELNTSLVAQMKRKEEFVAIFKEPRSYEEILRINLEFISVQASVFKLAKELAQNLASDSDMTVVGAINQFFSASLSITTDSLVNASLARLEIKRD